MSITQRITLLWILLFSGGLALFTLIASANVAQNEQRAMDSQLLTAARSAASAVDGQTGRVETEGIHPNLLGFGMALMRGTRVVQHVGYPIPRAVFSKTLPGGILVTVGRGPAYRVAVLPVPEWPGERVILYAAEDTVSSAVTRVHQSLLLALLPIVALAALAGWLLARSSLAPVDRMVATAASVARTGKFNERFPVVRSDEIGRLAQTFNAMLDSLQASFERERTFIGDVSHELRQPLSAVAAEAEFTLARERTTQEYRNGLKRIARRVDRLSETIADLLLLARADADALSARGESEVNEAVSEICANAIAAGAREGVRIRTVLADSPLRVSLTPELLRRLVDNLVRNAITAAHAIVEVAVDASRSTVTVSDDGPGIPQDRREAIFRRFVRGDSRSGAGLGLAIASAIASAASANITVDSRPGGGAQFTVTFPQRGRSGIPGHEL